MKIKISKRFDAAPGWLKAYLSLTLLPIIAAPVVYFGSIFIFDNPPNELLGWLLFIAVNSYSFLLLGAAKLSLLLHERYHNALLDFLPQIGVVLLLSTIFVVSDYIAQKDAPPSYPEYSDYTLFEGTTAEPLAQALEEKNWDKLKQLANSKNVNVREKQYGQTLLHLAALNFDPKGIKVLLSAGANPNVYDYLFGDTPLTIVCSCYYDNKKEQVDCAKKLLEYGAHINAWQHGGDTTKVDKDIIERYGDCDYYTPLIAATESGNIPLAQLLLSKGADVNYEHHQLAATALSCAVVNEYDELGIILLKHGANPTVRVYEEAKTIEELAIERLQRGDKSPKLKQIIALINDYKRRSNVAQ